MFKVVLFSIFSNDLNIILNDFTDPFLSKILREFGFDKSPTNIIPNKVINSLAPFNKEMKSTSFMIKRGSYEVDISVTESLFNWNPISLRKTLKDMTNSLKKV